MEVNSYDRTWFLRSLAASPLFIAVYLELWSWQASQEGWSGVAVGCGTGGVEWSSGGTARHWQGRPGLGEHVLVCPFPCCRRC